MARPMIEPGRRGEVTYSGAPGRIEAKCYVRDLDGTRHRVKASGETERDARDALMGRLALRDAGLGRGAVTAGMSVADLSLVWLVSLRGLSEATVTAYGRTVRVHVVPALGEIPVGEASAPALGSFLDNLAGESPAAARLARVVLRSMFALAVSAGVLAADPVPEDAAGTTRTPRRRPMSRIEFRRLRALAAAWMDAPTAGPPRSRDLLDEIDLLFGSGCRRVGEMLAASWEDFDFEGAAPSWLVSAVIDRSAARGLHVRAYDEAETYVIELPAFVVAMLRRRGPSAGLLFPGRAGGPVDSANFRRAMLAAAPEFSWAKPGALVEHEVAV